MATFTLYCDDSGTHNESEWAIAACVIAPVEQWEKFREEWQCVARDEGFEVFHLNKFVARKPPFDTPEWENADKRDRTMRRLIGIIRTRTTCAYASALQKSAYDEEVPEKIKADRIMGKNHYTFAVRMCMGRLVRWRIQHGYTHPIQFVFDRVSKGKGEIDMVFNRALSEGAESALAGMGIEEGGWSFEDKSQFIPIQAADVLAWEALHHMKTFSICGDQFKPRRSYLALREIPGMHKYYDREGLRELVAHLKSKAATGE
jgi:Protein of unknown function (DUF3800)